MTNSTTAARPLDLDKLGEICSNWKSGSISGQEAMLSMAALIAQARTARLDTTASASIYIRKATLDHIAASAYVKHEITVRTEPNEGWVALTAQPVQAGEAVGHGNTDHVGRDLDGMPQPFAGAIVLLETIAECGALAFFPDGTRTENSELCRRFADELRVAGRATLAPIAAQHAAAKAPAAQADAVAAMERAKKLSVWDDINHDLHKELDIIFKALAAFPASTPEAQDQSDAALWHALAEAFVKAGAAATTGRAIEMMMDAIKDPSGLSSTPEASQQAVVSAIVRAALKPHMEKLVGNYDPSGEAEECVVQQSMKSAIEASQQAANNNETGSK